MGGARRGGFAFDSYKDLFLGGDCLMKKKILVAGQPDLSFFMEKLDAGTPRYGVRMPLGLPPLSPELRSLVRAWITAGARKD